MLRFFAVACLLGGLAGCAGAGHPVAVAVPAPPHPVATGVAMSPHPARAGVPPLAERGTILAVRTVPSRAPQPVRLLLARLGGGPPATGSMEFIVRREDGVVLAVVQPDGPALRPGQRVLILPSLPPRIEPLPSMARR